MNKSEDIEAAAATYNIDLGESIYWQLEKWK